MTSNRAHWHLLVNHLPIMGSLMATLMLDYGLFRRSQIVRKIKSGLFVLLSIATALTNQTGKSAGRYLEFINALDKQRLQTDKQTTGWTITGMYLRDGLSQLVLVSKRAKRLAWLPALTVLTSPLRFDLMANVSRLSGLIMHQQLRNGNLAVHYTQQSR